VAPDDSDAQVDGSGFECRWQPLYSRRGEVVAVLIKARGASALEEQAIYRDLLVAMEEVLGSLDEASPAGTDSLELSASAADLQGEALIRRGRGLLARLHVAWAWVENQVGRVLMRNGWKALGFDGEGYAAQAAAQTDFRKFDDTLRAVLDMTAEEHSRLREILEAEREAGRVYYGTHAAPAALMTCAVRDRRDNHVHFVDGADGGYALAARELKAQVKQR